MRISNTFSRGKKAFYYDTFNDLKTLCNRLLVRGAAAPKGPKTYA